MKIKRSTSSSSTKRNMPMSLETSEFIGAALGSDDAGLLAMLEPHSRMDSMEWPFGRSDLHHWADLLDRFDAYYEEVIKALWDGSSGVQGKPFEGDQARLVKAMLGFTRSLLEYCSSRNLFNSYEHLKSFLASRDVTVVSATLELLALPARKLEAQQSLRKTFQETIGVEELAVLAGLNHPPFIEFHGMRSKPVDLGALRELVSELAKDKAEFYLVRLMSMSTYLLFMATLDIELDSSLFASQPTIIGDVARSLSVPATPMSIETLRRETAVIGLLRAALKVPSKSSEVVYALGVSAGHGPIAGITRLICAAVREQLDPGYHQLFLSAFLDFLTALALSFEADLSLAQAGLVEELVRALGNCLPRQYKLMERILTVLDILLHRLPEALDAFFGSDGLGAVVSQIARLTLDYDKAGDEMEHGESSLLNSHLRLLDRLIASTGGDDRLRNLVEGRLFKALRVVFERAPLFPSETLAFAVSILSAYIHNEPTSLAFLQEQGVPQSLLAALQSPDARIPPLGDLIVRLPQAFSALCLNSTGAEQFKQCNPTRRLLMLFLDPDTYLKPLKSHMAASELGRGLDEFMRHQPQFRDDTISALLEVLDGMADLLQQPASLYTLSPDKVGGTSMVTVKEAGELLKKREPHPGLAMFDLFTVALEGILQSPAHGKAFLQAGGLDRLLALYSRPGLPYDFPSRPEAHSISHLFRLLGETPLDGETETVLAAAWKHVFACSHHITDLFLSYRENPSESSSFFCSADVPQDRQSQVFTAMCSLQAILGLLGDLYLQQQYSFNSARQASQVLPGLATAEGETAMVFLSLLLGACVTELYLLEHGAIPKDLLDAIKPAQPSDDAASLVLSPQCPSALNARMVLWVVGRLPGLIMSLLGGVSRMLSLHSSATAIRRASLPSVEPSAQHQQKVSSLLANCLANNFRRLTGAPPETALSMLQLASALFFDEVNSRMTLQVLPLSTFAHIGGLQDLAACVQSVLLRPDGSGDETTTLQVLESYLILLGRILNVQVYRTSTWEDLAQAGFPAGLRSCYMLAAKTAQWCWSQMPDRIRLQPKHLRLVLALTTGLFSSLRTDQKAIVMKPYEAMYYEFFKAAVSGLGTERFPLVSEQEGVELLASGMAWIRSPPADLVPLIIARCIGTEAVLYDLCQLLLHLVDGPAASSSTPSSSFSSLFDLIISASSSSARIIALLLNSHRRADVLAQLVKPQWDQVKAIAQQTSPSSMLLAALLLAEGLDLEDALSIALSTLRTSTRVDEMHAALVLMASCTRRMTDETVVSLDIPSLVPMLVRGALVALDQMDLRHRSMLGLAMLSIRHLVEHGSYLALLMEPEVLAKFKSHGHRRLLLSALLPLKTGQSSQISAEPLALRSPETFARVVKECFQLDPASVSLASSTDLALFVKPDVASLEHKKDLLDRLYESNDMSKAVVESLMGAFMAIPALPVFQSAADSLAAEKEEPVVAGHFQRMALLMALSELVSSLPCCHSALLASPSCPGFLANLFGSVVPCGDLAMAGAQSASVLFVSGPVWVDAFLGHLCIGSAVPGLPAPLDRLHSNVDAVVAALSQCLEDTIKSPPSGEYARMSRVWCQSMTVYSLLNMRGGLHRQTEAAQQSVAKAMLERRLMATLARLLGSLRAELPGYAMVSAKLVLIMEALAKHARSLMVKRKRETALPAGAAVVRQQEDVPSAGAGAGAAMDLVVDEDTSPSDESMDGIDSDDMETSSAVDTDEAMMEEEEFGYAHSSSDESSAMSDEEMSIDLDDLDNAESLDDDSDDGESASAGDDSDDDDMMSMDDEFSTDEDGTDDSGMFDTDDGESVHIMMRPGDAAGGRLDQVLDDLIGEDDLDDAGPDEQGDNGFFFDDEQEGNAGRRRHHQHHAEGDDLHLFDDIDEEAEGVMDEYDSDEDDTEDDQDLLAMSDRDSPDEADEPEGERGGGGGGLGPGRMRLGRMPGRSAGANSFFESIFGSTGSGAVAGEGQPFSSLAARGATSGDLYMHPLLGRDDSSPACLSTRSVDLALLLRPAAANQGSSASSIGSSSVMAPIVAAPYRVPPPSNAGSPFLANREMLRTPAVSTSTFRRWSQSMRLLFNSGTTSGGSGTGSSTDLLSQDQLAILAAILEEVREALRPEVDAVLEALREAQRAVEEELKRVAAEKAKAEEDLGRAKAEEDPGKERAAASSPVPIETTLMPAQTAQTSEEAPVELAPPPHDFTDDGPDVDFLLALPFDMRTEVIQQHLLEERRSAIATALPSAATPVRVIISPAFLARLPDDLRQEYQRLSDRDAERYNRRVASARRRPVPSNEEDGEEEEEEMDEFMEDEEDELMELMGSGGGSGADLLQRISRSLSAVAATVPAGSSGAPGIGEFITRLQQSLRQGTGGAQRIEVRVHDPTGHTTTGAGAGTPSGIALGPDLGGLLDVPAARGASPSRGGAALLDGRVSPIPAPTLSVSRATLATLLRSYYEPTMSDKRTHHKLLTSLTGLPLEGGDDRLVRDELVGMLIQVLEAMPADLGQLENVLATGSKRKGDGTSSPGPNAPPSSSPSVVILQRTLQLLTYLVSHDDPTKHYFTRPSAAPWTVKRRSTIYEVRYPLVLLLACLEKGPILQVGLLVEFLLSLISTVSGPIRALVQRQASKAGEAGTRPSPSPAGLPVIPGPFLHALVRALCASELTPRALGHATAISQHLSKLPGVTAALLSELSEASLRIAESTGKDLAALVKDLKDGAVAEDGVLKTLASPTAAQTRLLRILKMALVLHGGAAAVLPGDDEKAARQRLCVDLAKPAWTGFMQSLPAALALIEEKQLLHVAMGLLPAIESFFLHQRLLDEGQSKKPNGSSHGSEDVLRFAEEHKRLLNSMIRTNPSLLTSGSFHALTQAPRLLDFDNKRTYFRSQLSALKRSAGVPTTTINLNVRRAYIFEDSYHQLIGRTGDELRAAKLNIKFHGEEGVDAGGVTREWFTELCRKMFNPDNGLFLPTALDSVALQPNRMSWVNPDHLQFFAFVGRILAKAIIDQRLLDVHFTRSFYKHLLGLPVDFRDLEAIDPDYHKSLQWILQNDITGVLDDMVFATEADEFGVVSLVDLKPGGSDVPVTEANKAEYVKLVTEYRLTTAIRPQIDAVLRGLHALLPPALLAPFTETELELLISGLPDIDIDDWRANTDYRSYTISSPQVQWFWRAVRSFDPEERAKLVQFVTGTAKVPLDGWAHLQGAQGRQRFTITKDFGPTHRLPSSHTCFNQLDLPAYESYEELRAQLVKAVTEGATGFGLV